MPSFYLKRAKAKLPLLMRVWTNNKWLTYQNVKTNQLAPVRVIRLASSSSISVPSHICSCPSHPSRGGVTSHWAIAWGSLVIRTHGGSSVRVCVRLHIVATSVSTVLVGTAGVCVHRGRRNREKLRCMHYGGKMWCTCGWRKGEREEQVGYASCV